MFKLLACWKLSEEYNLKKYDVFLPTGCDCILEEVLSQKEILDVYGCTIDIVQSNIGYLLIMGIPVAGIPVFFFRMIWRCRILYDYIIPGLIPDISDWKRLCYCLVPPLFYYRLWRGK